MGRRLFGDLTESGCWLVRCASKVKGHDGEDFSVSEFHLVFWLFVTVSVSRLSAGLKLGSCHGGLPAGITVVSRE